MSMSWLQFLSESNYAAQLLTPNCVHLYMISLSNTSVLCMTTQRVRYGGGLVRIDGQGVWALWDFIHCGSGATPGEVERVRIRLSLDELDRLGLDDCQRIRLKIGPQGEKTLSDSLGNAT